MWDNALANMAKEIQAIDITDLPELLRLVEEVCKTGQPRLLRSAKEDLAVLMPAARPIRKKRRKSKADFEAFLASAGGWDDVDTDKFLETVYASRAISTRPPPEL